MSVRAWMDYLKSGESAQGNALLWCASRAVDGHIVKIVTGKATRDEAIIAAGGNPETS
jgi:hypothetical protein